MMVAGIEAVAAVAATQATAPTLATSTTALANASAPNAFANLMQQGLTQLDSNVAAAESATRALASGQNVELHDVMISLERAQISVQTFVQVRNKLVESYQDLMRMQI